MGEKGKFAVFLIAVIFAIAWLGKGEKVSPPKGASWDSARAGADESSSLANESEYRRCKAAMKRAMDAGHISDMKATIPPKVFVGVSFYELSIGQKEALMDDAECFIMHGSARHLSFDILDGHSGKTVGIYGVSGYKTL